MSPELLPYLLLAFIVGLALGYFFLSRKRRALESELASMREQASQLEKMIASLETDNRRIPTLENENGRLTDTVRMLQGDRDRFSAQADRVPILEKTLDGAQRQIQDLRGAKESLEAELRSERDNFDKLNQAREELANQFEAISKRVLTTNSDSFLTLAQQKLGQFQEAAKGDLEKRQQAIAEHLTPIKERLEEVGRLNHDLKGQIGQLNETTRFVGTEASQLLRALRQPTGSGHYGEKLVRQILELSGMQEGLQFEEQVAFERSGKLYRADVVVNLSDGQRLVIDAKAPISDHLDYVQATDDKSREEKLKKLTQGLREYAKDLQGKEYWKQFEPSAGIVIMFVAPESALMAAMQYDPSLWDECIRKRVLLSCPTMLVGMLLTVGFGWRQARFADNAEKIQKVGQELYEDLFTFSNNYLKLGEAIKLTHDRYNKALGTLDYSVFPSVRHMKELGVPTGNKEIPEITIQGLDDKPVRSKEMIALTQPLPAAGPDGKLLES